MQANSDPRKSQIHQLNQPKFDPHERQPQRIRKNTEIHEAGHDVGTCKWKKRRKETFLAPRGTRSRRHGQETQYAKSSKNPTVDKKPEIQEAGRRT